ncbi:TMAO reductase system sensor histidine kinase/response regulator TorS [Zooshikella harenae]|nr:TMAO reductase system sensor histidine kinase/response regulator TorS [Zooshikella harenae]
MKQQSSIGIQLWWAFGCMITLLVLAAAISFYGFYRVSKHEHIVIEHSLPTMTAMHQLAQSTSRLVFAAGTLSDVTDQQSWQEQTNNLSLQAEELNTLLLKLLDVMSESDELRQVQEKVAEIVINMEQQSQWVAARLNLTNLINKNQEQLMNIAREIGDLASEKVNDTSFKTSNDIMSLYKLVEQNKSKKKIYLSLDNLLKEDLQQLNQMSELRLQEAQLSRLLIKLELSTDEEEVTSLEKQYKVILSSIKQLLSSLRDPKHRNTLTEHIQLLEASNNLFARYRQLLKVRKHTNELTLNNMILSGVLAMLVADLVDEASDAQEQSIQQVKDSLQISRLMLIIVTLLGSVILSWVMWRIVYGRIVWRINQHIGALNALAAGDLNIQLIPQGNDELAVMAHAINIFRDQTIERNRLASAEQVAKEELEKHKNNLELLVADRTEQLTKANQQLNQAVQNHARARQDAEAANRAKTVFLATMSHEIRTPMNGILGTLQLLSDTPLNDQQQHYINVLSRSSETLLAILNDILDYSKIEAGHIELNPQHFYLPELISSVVDLLQAKISEKKLNISIEIAEKCCCWYFSDLGKMRQILINLIANAVKFTSFGSITLQVIYLDEDTRHKTNRLRFNIIDSGVGVPVFKQAELFSPFKQVHGSSGGTGLGLAISKRLVEAMSGTIGVESESGKGSCFWFEMELATGKEVRALVKAQKAQVPPQPILLVEDNEINRMVAEELLQKLGHKVTTARDGQQAEKAVRKQKFTIALVDINLPDTEGTVLAKHLNNIALMVHQQPLYTIAVSAHVFREEVSHYLSAGMNDFVAKPLKMTDLQLAISRFVEFEENTSVVEMPYESQDEESDFEPLKEHPLFSLASIQEDIDVLGIGTLQRMASIFLTASVETWEQLVEAIKKHETSLITQRSHRLKGSAQSLGLLRLATICETLERQSRQQENINYSLDYLQGVWEESVKALECIDWQEIVKSDSSQ